VVKANTRLIIFIPVPNSLIVKIEIFSMRKTSILILLCCMFSIASIAQQKKKERKKEFYFSWGYNKEWYTNSSIKINQPNLGNNYSFVKINGHDNPGWNDGLFSKPLTVPQYNYRVGLFINKKKGLAIELNFDHTKFIFADQRVRIKGTLNGRYVDSAINFNRDSGFYYYLNNGANFFLFNIVKRWQWYTSKSHNIKIDFLGKAGVGPVVPHVENSFFNKKNNDGFQLGGWNVGVEAAIRATFFNYVYLEYCNKLDYARYSNLKVFEGRAKHSFGTYEMILNLGVTFPVGSIVK
jgi:hypothetical protein